MALWLGVFLVYKALVLLYGVHMSWKVRTVYTRKLIDAQYCAILLIVALPFCILGLIFAFSLRLYPTPHYALVGIIIIIYSFIVLVSLFGHKVLFYTLFILSWKFFGLERNVFQGSRI